MGNSVTVENRTSQSINLSLRYAGHVNITEETVDKNERKQVSLNGIETSEIIILSVNNEACRAIKSKSKVIVSLNASNAFQIIPVYNFSHNNYEIFSEHLFWNIISKNTQDDAINDVNKLNKVLNDITANISQMIGFNVVQVGPDYKYANKYVTDAISGYLKVPMMQNNEKSADSKILWKLNKINNLLISIVRAKDNELSKYQNDSLNAGEFLMELIHKITISDCLPFLESCGVLEAIPIYLFAMNIFAELGNELKKINQSENDFIKNYSTIFFDNLESMIDETSDNISEKMKMKTSGLFRKKAKLFYDDNVVYIIKSFRKSNLIININDVKEAFIKNRKYQLEMSLGNPRQILKEFRDQFKNH